MNDKAAKYVKMIKKHVDRVIVAVVYVLLIALIYLWYNETGEGGSTTPQEKAPTQLSDPVAANPNHKRIGQMLQPADISKAPDIEQVRKFNMFDYKSVKDKQRIEQEANQTFERAQAAAKRGEKDEAKRLLGEALAQFPSHQKARDLLDSLNKGGGGAPAPPAPGAAPTPPAATTPKPSPASAGAATP